MNSSLLIQALIAGVTNGFVYALVGMGLAVIFKGSHVINAAQGDCAVIGAITAVLLLSQLGVPYLLAVLGGGTVSALLCAAIDVAFVRHMKRRNASEESYLLLTIGISLTLSAVLLFVLGRNSYGLPALGGDRAFLLMDAVLVEHAAWLVVGGMALTAALQLFYRRTTLGLSMMAASIDADGAATTGIDVTRMRTLTFATGGLIGAFAGILVAPLVAMDYQVGVSLTLKGFAAAILGGLSNPLGAVVGGLTIALLEAFAITFISSSYKDVIAYSLLIVIMVALPHGMLGRAARAGG
ncbi:MAG: branched-chain amino acid ABC transporter permease [Chitinophagaceae bacterium]|nr:branched-chain amino acid ABC transporter permease [Rubrivivax sp.]